MNRLSDLCYVMLYYFRFVKVNAKINDMLMIKLMIKFKKYFYVILINLVKLS